MDSEGQAEFIKALRSKDQELEKVNRLLEEKTLELELRDGDLAKANESLQVIIRNFELLNLENSEITSEMINIYLSRSWRMTRGLRWLLRKIKA